MTWGTYVHVPWCRRRCPYCAFYVEADRDVPWTAFVDAVLREHARRAPEFGDRPTTLFLGGGTPSRLPGPELARLVAALGPVDGEVTVEANPEDVDDAWLDAALAAGITRLSLGIQTFDPRFARLLNRASTVDQARATVARVGASGLGSWSVDVIFALPGQTVEMLRTDLDAILATEPPHVSLYGLTIEPGTPFERARDRGQLVPPDDATWRAMYDLLVDELEAAGLHRYEVSNFARDGHRSAHNTLYWTDRPYLGLGPSAHGYAPDGRRWVNVADADAYLTAPDPTASSEHPTPEQRAIDLLVSGLRGVDGVPLALLEATTGHTVADRGPLVEAGLLADDPARLRLTPAGFPVADAIVARLATYLHPIDRPRASDPTPH